MGFGGLRVFFKSEKPRFKTQFYGAGIEAGSEVDRDRIPGVRLSSTAPLTLRRSTSGVGCSRALLDITSTVVVSSVTVSVILVPR